MILNKMSILKYLFAIWILFFATVTIFNKNRPNDVCITRVQKRYYTCPQIQSSHHVNKLVFNQEGEKCCINNNSEFCLPATKHQYVQLEGYNIPIICFYLSLISGFFITLELASKLIPVGSIKNDSIQLIFAFLVMGWTAFFIAMFLFITEYMMLNFYFC
jgi:hypothetical protein